VRNQRQKAWDIRLEDEIIRILESGAARGSRRLGRNKKFMDFPRAGTASTLPRVGQVSDHAKLRREAEQQATAIRQQGASPLRRPGLVYHARP